MQVKQISTILNGIFAETIGDSIFEEDLSNIVSTGRLITGASTFDNNFDNYAGKIIDKVGKVVLVDRVYKAKDLGLWVDSWEYGSVLEKIRCDVGDFEDNAEWDLTEPGTADLDYNEHIQQHIEDMFKFYPANVQARYFNAKTTHKAPISISRKQLKESFDSASKMARFIGMIENRIVSKLEIGKEATQKRALLNLMAHDIKKGTTSPKCVDMKAEFEAAGGAVLPSFTAALNDRDFGRFLAKKLTMDRKLMTAPSKAFSDSNFYNFTPLEESRLILLADVDASLKFNLYGDTYNEEFVKLDNYKTVPFWQSSANGLNLGARSRIYVTDTDGDKINQPNVIGVLFDRTAVMVCNDNPEVRSQYNMDGNFTNFMYCTDCSYYNDFDENSVVYVWGLATE